jgi:putative addiction module killer protein
MKDVIDIQIYETDEGKCPYLQWEDRLGLKTRSIITARLARIRLGNFGDCKSIQGARALYELRIHYESGYRIYFTKRGKKVVLLLVGGDKSSQKSDIRKASEYLHDYLSTCKDDENGKNTKL